MIMIFARPVRLVVTVITSLLPTMIVIMLAGACAATPATPPSGPVSSGPLPRPDPGATLSEEANPVSPEPADDLHRERFAKVEPVAGRPSVRVFGTLTGGPPCAVLGRVAVEETADAVTLTVWAGRRAGSSCDPPDAQLAFPYVTTVALQAPVGDRTVRDGAA
jgi:hypothetical protein